MSDPEQPEREDGPPHAIAPTHASGLDVEARRVELLDHVDALRSAALSNSTIRAYASDLRDLAGWAADYPDAAGAVLAVKLGAPLPPEILAAYLAHCDQLGLSAPTIRRRCSAVARWHRSVGIPSPTTSEIVREVLAGITRTHARGGQRGAPPFTASMVRAALPKLDVLERAVILVGVVGGLRRSELIALRWGWLSRTDYGLACTLGAQKNRPGGGHVIGLPRTCGDASRGCPVAALRDLELERWAGEAPRDALIFPISASTVRRIVRTAASAAGENPQAYSPHSLRAGMCSIAAAAGVSLGVIREQSGHRSVDVAAGYVRTAEATTNAAALAVARSFDTPTPPSS